MIFFCNHRFESPVLDGNGTIEIMVADPNGTYYKPQNYSFEDLRAFEEKEAWTIPIKEIK